MEIINLQYLNNDFERIDKYLNSQFEEFTRTQIQLMIEEGLIKVSKHGKYGLLDTAVNLVFRCVFDSIQVVNHERIIAKFEGASSNAGFSTN